MFRAAVLSVVLTLAFGPNATVLCAVWCHPEGDKTSACQHQDATTSPQVIGEDGCRTVPAAATAFVREEAKRESRTAGAQHAVLIPPFRFAPSLTETTRTNDPSTLLAVGSPPLLIALRI